MIAEYRLPAEDFLLGRTAVPGVSLELKRLLDGDRGRKICYFWATGSARDDFERSLEADGSLEEFREIDSQDGRWFYRGECDPEGDSLVSALAEFDVDVLTAQGNHEQWGLRVAFEGGRMLSDFQSYCVDEAEVALELQRLYNPVESAPQIESDLTPRQRETLIAAYDEGYFDIPRQVTLVDLARTLDVSDQAISERLRRGESKLIRTYLLDD